MEPTNYPRLDLADLIGVICRFYPDHTIEELIWDFQKNQRTADVPLGDGLARFLVVEAEETFEEEDSPVAKIYRVIGLFERAESEILEVVSGLRGYALDWAMLEFCELVQAQGRKHMSEKLLLSWIEMHPSEEVREGTPELVQRLEGLFPGIGASEDGVDVSPFSLDSAIRTLRQRLERCPSHKLEPEPAPAAAPEPVPAVDSAATQVAVPPENPVPTP